MPSESAPKDPRFVGRRTELRKLTEFFSGHGYGEVVKIVGVGGIGKTALAREFLRREHAENGLEAYEVSLRDIRQTPEYFNRSFIDARIGKESKSSERPKRMVVIMDGADEMSEDVLTSWYHTIFNYKVVRGVIVTTRQSVELRARELHLLPLTSDDARELLTSTGRFSGSQQELQSLLERTGRIPSALLLVADLLRRLPVQDVLARMQGAIYTLKTEDERAIIQAVRPQIVTFSGNLVEKLQKSPEKIHEVSSRQFEQIVADLFDDMGWQVKLTQATRDGGRDILAQLNTGVARFLCLIETKKNRKDRPIGVGLVRQLYGTFVDEGANSAMLVTTSYFSPDAKKFREKHPYQLSLKDYTDVVSWLGKYKGGNVISL